MVKIYFHFCFIFMFFSLKHCVRYGVSLRIQSKCRKIQTRKTPNTDTFYEMNDSNNFLSCLLLLLKIACRQLGCFPYCRQGKSRQSWDTTYNRFSDRYKSRSTDLFILSPGQRYSASLFFGHFKNAEERLPYI